MSFSASIPMLRLPRAAASGAARPPVEANELLSFKQRPLGFLLHYVRKHSAQHAVVAASVTVAVVASVLTQYGIKQLIDAVAHGAQSVGAQSMGGQSMGGQAMGGQAMDSGVWAAFAVLCVLIAADNMTWRIGGWMAARAFVAVSGDVRRDLFSHLTGHSPSYFSERLPGTLAGRITATANACFQVETTTTWNVLPPSLAVVISIGLISTVNAGMAVFLVAVSAALAVVIYRLAAKGTPLHRDYAGRAAAVDGELVDVIGNMGVVRAFGATLRERERVSERVGVEMGARRRSLIYLEKLRLIHAATTALLCAGLLAWGIVMWEQGHASPGDLVLICSLGFTILHSTRDLAVALVDLTQHVARLEEAVDALLVPHGLPDRPDARPMLRDAASRDVGRVSFQGVTFAYPGRPPVLKGLDLEIAAGQRIGLVGASGAGKSTVLSVLQRFYDIDAGSVMIDGQDISRVTQESLRQMIAVVPQDISLFHRSVLENIRYARPEATEAEVLAAAEMAHCRDFIEALPEGFNTMVGDRGTKLSGGQRQRLAIARALLKNAPILLLDEATSALDSESEAAIQAALDTLMQGRTVIAVAHRLSTLRNFDRVVVMEAGRVIQDGAPLELAHRAGPYRDLLRAQQSDTTEEFLQAA